MLLYSGGAGQGLPLWVSLVGLLGAGAILGGAWGPTLPQRWYPQANDMGRQLKPCSLPPPGCVCSESLAPPTHPHERQGSLQGLCSPI